MIGIFDSGSGGLSVYREIVRILPEQHYVYVSDNAHCPYGDKNREYIQARASTISEFLAGQGCEVIVVACNTATAAALSHLRATYVTPFIGTEPAIDLAARSTSSGVIGVLATAGTLKSSYYRDTRDSMRNVVTVVEQVGRGFVELVESGDLESAHAEDVVQKSVKPLVQEGADVLVLGCTHYPFLRPIIEKVVFSLDPERQFQIVDSAATVARQLALLMYERGLLSAAEYKNALSRSMGMEHSGPYSITETQRYNLDLYASGNLNSLEHILALIRTSFV